MVFEFTPRYRPGEITDVETFGGEFGCFGDCGGGWFVFCGIDMFCCDILMCDIDWIYGIIIILSENKELEAVKSVRKTE